MKTRPAEILLSVPNPMNRSFDPNKLRLPDNCFLTADPPQTPLGSGGGTSHLLHEAWKESGSPESFEEWTSSNMRILVHGGGQSKRLPSYAATGKLFIPIPAFRWALGQRVDQSLLDIQLPLLERIAATAPTNSHCMVVSGDVLLRSEGALPKLPDADVILFGLWAQPEQARSFGVMFCDRENPQRLLSFLQKPPPEKTRKLAEDYMFMIDIGVWLLSDRAVSMLMKRCGWDRAQQMFAGSQAHNYDMYGEWGLHLGENPHRFDDEISSLSVAAVPLPEGEFYHYGCSRDIIDSTYQLQNLVKDQTKLGVMRGRMYASNFVQNSRFDAELRESVNHTIWIENSHVPESWVLSDSNVITGAPENNWKLTLPAGACIDFVPLDSNRYAIRNYHIDDTFKGAIEDDDAIWMGAHASDWFRRRDIDVSSVLQGCGELQRLPLFAVLDTRNPATEGFVQWLLDPQPLPDKDLRMLWVESERVSARDIALRADVDRIMDSRHRNRLTGLQRMAKNAEHSVFYRLDLEATSQYFLEEKLDLPESMPADHHDPLMVLHNRIFKAQVLESRGDAGGAEYERQAFSVLRDVIIDKVQQHPVDPVCDILEDQIVWGRAPVRLDFAGGWTDTPPYCLEFGGSVVNAAVDLNGQPPIQAFARISHEPGIVVRSIDLGIEDRIATYEDVAAYGELGSGFSIARAAMALAGFHPRFSQRQFATLRKQLEDFGGGIELSMLCAVPKGSGLGTSSILAITLLGTLSDMLGLGWDFNELVQRTSALEQMLTSGGGWQDQIGGVLRGVKLVETSAGIEQQPLIRWLPHEFFNDPHFAGRLLLYYTGVTRVAHNILGEIVRGIFLNSSARLAIIDEIKLNARYTYDCILRHNFAGFTESIGRSWELNKSLDAGTSVPDVERIISRCGSELEACKLLGAGGGGYMFMVARDRVAAETIRQRLDADPPNRKARFVDFSISGTGLQTTRS